MRWAVQGLWHHSLAAAQFACVTATACVTTKVEAQMVPLDTVRTPVRTLARGFIRVRNTREISRDLALVIDSRYAIVELVDFAKNSTLQIGRQGDGPGEYRMPSGLIPLPGGPKRSLSREATAVSAFWMKGIDFGAFISLQTRQILTNPSDISTFGLPIHWDFSMPRASHGMRAPMPFLILRL